MGRVVVISGGGTGIGWAAAELFSASGDEVVLLGRREAVLAQAADRLAQAHYCAADLSNPKGARRAADFIRKVSGRVDVVVNNAGGNGVLEPDVVHDDPLEAVAHAWTLTHRLNTLTAVLLTEAVKDLLTAPGARVLFVSSISAFRGSGRVEYGASKAALHPYVFSLARELGPRGITVNAVAPGLIADTPFFGEPMNEQRQQLRAAETATGRIGTPLEVAHTLRWLASEDAGHITAQVIQVNGGAHSSR
ncbi:MAG TPA: SDR family oxidoreductase [Kribbella sp.]